MIQLNRIEPQTVDLYNPNNEWLGLLHEPEGFFDLISKQFRILLGF